MAVRLYELLCWILDRPLRLDLTPANILRRIHRLDGLTEDEDLKILGAPTGNTVLKGSDGGAIQPPLSCLSC